MTIEEFKQMTNKAARVCSHCQKFFTTPKGRKIHERRKKHFGGRLGMY